MKIGSHDIVIRCALCDRPVQRVTTYQDPQTGIWTIRVQCHGEAERMELTQSMLLHDFGPDVAVIEAVAFRETACLSPYERAQRGLNPHHRHPRT